MAVEGGTWLDSDLFWKCCQGAFLMDVEQKRMSSQGLHIESGI